MSALPAKADSWPTHLGYSAATSKRAEPAGAIVPKRSSHKASIEIKNIKAANDAYYRALSARDMHAMEKVWTGAADNMLIAPTCKSACARRLGGNQAELGGVLAGIRQVPGNDAREQGQRQRTSCLGARH